MKELMLRLIKNGKIVGYEKRIKLSVDDSMVSLRSQHLGDSEEWWDFWDENSAMCQDDFSHDSFDMGIKVGDEWWFDGDRIYKEVTSSDDPAYGYYGHNGMLKYKDGYFGIEWDDDKEYSNDAMGSPIYLHHDIKRIGNIYEKEGLRNN